MNFTKTAQCRGTEEFSVKRSNDLRKPKVESMDQRRQMKEREMAIKSILNKASAISW